VNDPHDNAADDKAILSVLTRSGYSDPEVTVMARDPMTEADWRKAHALAGQDHPGRFKAWAWESGFLFGPMGPLDAEAVRGLLRGLRIRHDIETRQDWLP
jgi:hypothetical protein